MPEPVIRHQLFEYRPNEPFVVSTPSEENAGDTFVKNSHWHEELEIAYVLRGSYRHYIDGEPVAATPGRMIVTNCESVHRIEVTPEDMAQTVVLIVHNRFIEENFLEYRDFLFTNERDQASEAVRDIMMQFAEYGQQEHHTPYDHLYMRGLLLQLLYYLYEEGSVSRTNMASVSVQRREQAQPLKEILHYVEEAYREPITQATVARQFYFTPQYFARYFKRYTGVTFGQHLTAYRINQARHDLLNTDRRICDIARDHGFADDRSFIHAFKNAYHMTPSQYRKNAL